MSSHAADPGRVRVGYFANISHAQALIGLEDGSFKKALGDQEIKTFVFNAGPSAVEAIFAGEIDITYVGPNPAINAYMKSKGEAVRVIAGASSGGARLVARKGSGIRKAEDLNGRKLATPQLGNTQDVAARAWLVESGLNSMEKGGKVQVIPVKNADQIALFSKGELDASWAVEPWATRLIHETGAVEVLDERKLWKDGQFSTAVVVVRKKFLDEKPEAVKAFLKAHVEVTEKIRANPKEAKASLNAALQKITGKALPVAVLDEAFSKLEITHDPLVGTLEKSAKDAFKLGFLGKTEPELKSLADLTLLQQVLNERKKAGKK